MKAIAVAAVCDRRSLVTHRTAVTDCRYSICSPRPSSAFTLIELMVVIAILAVLIGLLFPAFQGVQNQAKKVQAKNDLTQIVTAVNAFYTEYGRYPTTATTDATAIYGPGGTSNDALFNELRAKVAVLNTRQIVFISPPDVKDPTTPRSGIGTTTGAGQWYGPWGSPYIVAIDGNYDNSLANPYGPTGGAGADPLAIGVIAWSFGKNGALGGGAAASANFTKESGTAGTFTNSSDVISWQ